MRVTPAGEPESGRECGTVLHIVQRLSQPKRSKHLAEGLHPTRLKTRTPRPDRWKHGSAKIPDRAAAAYGDRGSGLWTASGRDGLNQGGFPRTERHPT